MLPKVSIVTINYQMRDGLRKTINSVASQNYSNVEYIVIDGGSTDGSLDVILNNLPNISCWVSEPDRGLYDAMNKGVQRATGTWLIFMNSDDYFIDSNVISDVFSRSYDADDIIYGHMVRRYEKYHLERVVLARPIEAIRWSMVCSHQSVFARRSLLLKWPLDCGLAADYEFLLKGYSAGLRFVLLDRVISSVSAGGASDQNRVQSILSRWRALRNVGLASPALMLAYGYFILRAVLAAFAKKVLGARLTTWVLQKKGPDRD